MLLLPLFALSLTASPSHSAPIAQASAESLKGYRYPEWFRDAKFGIWAHWGPQAVPGQGDWFARRLYQQGDPDYQYHLEHYGHPSKFGYKDIIPLWKAEKWDPDRLMALYKKAGARYFVSMGVHHDNFDLWNSKYHRWNAVNMGPHRDVVGTWQKAAKKQGLKFGVSEHLGASFTWFQASHGSDKTGPLAGVPYDGANPKYWDLYHQPAKPGDTGWYSNDPAWQAEWRQRIGDLVDSYHPDLLYSDGGVPFGNSVGYGLISHFYATKPDVVYTCKQPSNGLWVEDFERGVMKGVSPYPFQTDTSIGDWFYNVHWKFRDIKWVVHMLVDDVSKNGNLLLNVVQRPDGSLDPEVLTLLHQMADWINVNGEGIYGTRPWITFGEGKERAKGGNFGEDVAYTGDDIRFTTKKGALYAFCLGRPTDGKLDIRSLASHPGSGEVTGVRLLGDSRRLSWKQDSDGLHVQFGTAPTSEVASCLKITGRRLRDFTPAVPAVATITPDSNGVLTLPVAQAALVGSAIAVEAAGGQPNLGYWDSPSDFAFWKVHIDAPGDYSVNLSAACPRGEPELRLEWAPGQSVTVRVGRTPSFTEYAELPPIQIHFPASGTYQFAVKPVENGWSPVNLRAITIRRA